MIVERSESLESLRDLKVGDRVILRVYSYQGLLERTEHTYWYGKTGMVRGFFNALRIDGTIFEQRVRVLLDEPDGREVSFKIDDVEKIEVPE